MPAGSVTSMVKLEVPRTVGVPEITTELPVLVPKLKPIGKFPALKAQVNGPVAPCAFTYVVYGVFKVAAGSEVVIIVSTAFTEIDTVAVTVVLAMEVAVMVALELVDKVGGAL